MKIGIIKEGKVPIDKRVAFTPKQCKEIVNHYPEIKIKVQTSAIRCFTDDEYKQEGIDVVEDVSDCEVLFGVKEVPIQEILSDKMYFFFSHTIKAQTYNRKLLQTILQKKVQLVDYECLKNETGQRIVAFGRFAGIVGAYNALWAYGQKHKCFDLKRAFLCHDIKELFEELEKVSLPPIKIVLTGAGRVAKGALEILDKIGIKKIEPVNFSKTYNDVVYCQIDSKDYNQRVDGNTFEFNHFIHNPKEYKSSFKDYFGADVLIAAAYWDPNAPALFSKSQMQDEDFKINLIADITCDIEGSIPSTIKSTTIEKPVFDLNLKTWKEEHVFENTSNLTVMSVDNLPCELSRDASESFGEQLISNVIPCLLDKQHSNLIEGSSIAKEGQLTVDFKYLTDFVSSNS